MDIGVMIILALAGMAGLGFFLYLKLTAPPAGKKNTANRLEETNGSAKGNQSKNELKELLEIEHIYPNGILRLKGGRYRRIYAVTSPDFELLTDEEQEVMENALMQFALSISSPIMFYTTMSKVDIEEPLKNIKRTIDNLSNDEGKLLSYSKELYRELRKQQDESRAFVRKSYCVIGTANLNEDKALRELGIIEQNVLAGLARAKVQLTPLNGIEVLQLLSEAIDKNRKIDIKSFVSQNSLDYFITGLGVYLDDGKVETGSDENAEEQTVDQSREEPATV